MTLSFIIRLMFMILPYYIIAELVEPVFVAGPAIHVALVVYNSNLILYYISLAL